MISTKRLNELKRLELSMWELVSVVRSPGSRTKRQAEVPGPNQYRDGTGVTVVQPDRQTTLMAGMMSEWRTRALSVQLEWIRTTGVRSAVPVYVCSASVVRMQMCSAPPLRPRERTGLTGKMKQSSRTRQKRWQIDLLFVVVVDWLDHRVEQMN